MGIVWSSPVPLAWDKEAGDMEKMAISIYHIPEKAVNSRTRREGLGGFPPMLVQETSLEYPFSTASRRSLQYFGRLLFCEQGTYNYRVLEEVLFPMEKSLGSARMVTGLSVDCPETASRSFLSSCGQSRRGSNQRAAFREVPAPQVIVFPFSFSKTSSPHRGRGNQMLLLKNWCFAHCEL